MKPDYEMIDGLCVECGMPGPHKCHAQCINALRSRMGELEFEADRARNIRAELNHAKDELKRLKRRLGNPSTPATTEAPRQTHEAPACQIVLL
jgi:hypothetical protein